MYTKLDWGAISEGNNADSSIELLAMEKVTLFMILGNVISTLDGQTLTYHPFSKDEIEAFLSALQFKML
jgi:hypothetical protein